MVSTGQSPVGAGGCCARPWKEGPEDGARGDNGENCPFEDSEEGR